MCSNEDPEQPKVNNFLKNTDHCIPRVSDLEGLKRILRICISNERPGDAKAAGLGTTLGELLRVPWTTRRSNQSILKKISPEYSLEGLMLQLKLQYFGHLMRRCWERLKAGGEGDARG